MFRLTVPKGSTRGCLAPCVEQNIMTTVEACDEDSCSHHGGQGAGSGGKWPA